MPQIYLDHAATTALHPAVLEAMMPYLKTQYYNPSTSYQAGIKVKRQIENVREMIAHYIHAKPEEIYFTSGGTEADNWFLNSCLYRNDETESVWEDMMHSHIITSCMEHHAILNTCHQLERYGCRVSYLPVDKYGRVNLRDLENAITKDTKAISILFANNEVGTIQPIGDIGRIAESYGIPFHTDAVQACGHIPIDVRKLHINALSASAHKFQGPKGIGFFYADASMPLHNFMYGGGQERGLRAGTENVAGIVGMGKAFEIANQTMASRAAWEMKLRDYMIRRIMQEIPYARINGHLFYRLPNNVNVAFQFVNGASLLVMLDEEEICVSAGSACNSGSAKPSHVIQALHVPPEYENGVIRMTLGPENTIEEVEHVVMALKKHVLALRKESPEYEDFEKR